MGRRLTIETVFWTRTLESLLKATRAITEKRLPGTIVLVLILPTSIGICYQIRASLIILTLVVVIGLPIAVVLLVTLATVFLAFA